MYYVACQNKYPGQTGSNSAAIALELWNEDNTYVTQAIDTEKVTA